MTDVGDLFPFSWQTQKDLQALQNDINQSMQEASTLVTSVLAKSTSETLQQHEDHVNAVEGLYVPVLDAFHSLSDSDCKNMAESILNSTTTFTGFDGSICASAYNTQIGARIDAANSELAEVDGMYGPVQSIVVKSFSGKNAFSTPEIIQETIQEMYDLVKFKWSSSSSGLDAIRASLSSNIADINKALANCHSQIILDVSPQFAYFRRMVQTCTEFDNTRDPFDLSGRFARSIKTYEQLFAEYSADFEKLKPVEWHE